MENFNNIYDTNYDNVSGYVRSKIKDSFVAEELTNDVFIKIHKSLDRFDENLSSMSTWIMNITNNVLIDYWRKRKLETISIQSNEEEGIMYTGWFSNSSRYASRSVEHNYISNESVGTITKRIHKLDEKYSEVARLYFIEELTYEEICKVTNLPIGTVKGQLFRARKILKSKIKRS
jgi:RNA polymerase sigma-70 factor (ECF subfamily)